MRCGHRPAPHERVDRRDRRRAYLHPDLPGTWTRLGQVHHLQHVGTAIGVQADGLHVFLRTQLWMIASSIVRRPQEFYQALSGTLTADGGRFILGGRELQREIRDFLTSRRAAITPGWPGCRTSAGTAG